MMMTMMTCHQAAGYSCTDRRGVQLCACVCSHWNEPDPNWLPPTPVLRPATGCRARVIHCEWCEDPWNNDPVNPIVYYMAKDGLVKIGFTTNLHVRLRTIRPQRLMGWEFGNRGHERMRHEQFADLREVPDWAESGDGVTEWFRLDGTLKNHLEEVESRLPLVTTEPLPGGPVAPCAECGRL